MEASIANIPEMPDLALFEACVTSDDEAFQQAARKELIAVRAYSESDIEDEIDRILDRRAQASRDAMDLPYDWEPDYDAVTPRERQIAEYREKCTREQAPASTIISWSA